jgi:hypothetical protein
MGLERSLLCAYVLGTREEIRNYVQGQPSDDLTQQLTQQDRRDYLSYAFCAELSASLLSWHVFPSNLDSYAAAILFSDAILRCARSIPDLVKFAQANRNGVTLKQSDVANATQQPGLVGTIRELVRKIG